MVLTPKTATCAAAATALVLTAHAFAQNPRRSVTINGREAVAGEVLVRFARQPVDTERLAIEQDADAVESEPVGPVLRRLRSRSLDVAALIASLRRRAIVQYAEPNYLWHATISPNDPQFGNLWRLRNAGQT